MPKPSEVAKLIVSGIKFEDWESVWVQDRLGEPWALFRFTCAEREPLPDVWTKLQFRPRDDCQIVLADQPAIDGVILERQVAYDATSHMVQLSGVGKTYFATKSSVLHETNNFDGKDFETVAREVLKPFGISPKIIGLPSKTPFKELQCQPGENVWEFLERIARVRRIALGSDPMGNFLIIGDHTGNLVQDLIEGINILKMQCILSCKDHYDIQRILGQGASHDDSYGREKKEQSAEALAGFRLKRFSIKITPAEQPTVPQELPERAAAERQWHEYTDITATITVQGWLRSGGALWHSGELVHVKSPMAMLDHNLKIQQVTFTQDSSSGTLTTLECVNPALYNDRGMNVGRRDMQGTGKEQPAQDSSWTTSKEDADSWNQTP